MAVQVVPIFGGTIELGALLKLAQCVQSGGEAKALIQSGAISVNGELETRRHRQLQVGDRVRLPDGSELLLTARALG